jgi:hypothetical protein
LVDAGFADARRWERLREAMSSGRPGIEWGRANEWLPAGEGRLLALSTLLVAWALLQWNRAEACALLGMSRASAAIVENLGVDELSTIAAHDTEWIRPRWVEFPRAWLELLEFARASASRDLSFGTLRCLQLSGGESHRHDRSRD